MGGGGPTGGSSQSVTKAEIPAELKPLYSATAQGIMQMQNMLPMWGGAAYPNYVPPSGLPSAYGYAYSGAPAAGGQAGGQQAGGQQAGGSQYQGYSYPYYGGGNAAQYGYSLSPSGSLVTAGGHPDWSAGGGQWPTNPSMIGYGGGGIPLYDFGGGLYYPTSGYDPSWYGGYQNWQQQQQMMGGTAGMTPTPYQPPTIPYGTEFNPYMGDYGSIEYLQGYGGYQPGGGGGYYTGGNYNPYGAGAGGAGGYGVSPNFLAPNPQEVAILDPMQIWGMGLIPGILNTPQASYDAYQMAMAAPGVAGQQPEFSNLPFNQVEAQTRLTPEQYASILQSPGLQATRGAFETGVSPIIEQQMALSGLGTSSSLANSLALGWSQMAPQAIESEFGRMERGMERDIALSQWNEAQRLAAEQWNAQMATGLGERAITREAQTMASMVPQLAGLGEAETMRQLQAINSSLQAGEMARGVEQQYYNAQYADFLRRQALAEQSLFGPMGMFPSTIGQSTNTTTTQTGGGGGLFK